MIYTVRHTTRYMYAAPVSQCYNMAYMIPRRTDSQKVLSTEMDLKPWPSSSSRREDYFGNSVYHFSVEKPHEELEITVKSRIEKADSTAVLALDIGNSCEQVKAMMRAAETEEDIAASEFLYESPMLEDNRELSDFAADIFRPDRPLFAAVQELSSRIYKEFAYDPSFSTVATPLAEVLEQKRGVCQDFAHLAIAALRSLGYPARYVSGYLETLPPPGQEKLEGADASHAWFSVYSPNEGWLDFDPTNDVIPGEQHLTTAWGRDYSDVTPVKGVLFGGGGSQTLEVEVDVRREDKPVLQQTQTNSHKGF